MNTTTYPKCIASRIKDLNDNRDHAIRLIDVAAAVELVMEGFPDLSPIVSASFEIDITVYVKERMSEVVALIRALRTRGFRVQRWHDAPKERYRVYSMGRIGEDDRCICIVAHIPTTTKCSYVKVGEKTVDVMELRCDEAEATP